MVKFHAKILTLFPEAFPGALDLSIIGKSKGRLWDVDIINIRDYAKDKHKTVDEKPAGGGHGMVIKPDVLSDAIQSNDQPSRKKYFLSPRGRVLNQRKAYEILDHRNIMMICGRYEGVDQRILDYYDVEEISIGDYILSGGEIAAQVVMDCCIRLIDGVLSGDNPHQEESLSPGEYENLLEYPHYTKPNNWNNLHIPEILLSGNHQKVADWRLQQAKNLTKIRRPDLWKNFLDKKD